MPSSNQTASVNGSQLYVRSARTYFLQSGKGPIQVQIVDAGPVGWRLGSTGSGNGLTACDVTPFKQQPGLVGGAGSGIVAPFARLSGFALFAF